MKYLLGVDLGTTAVKVGLFDSQARKICSSTQEYRLITESHFVVEQEVSVYWDAFKAGPAGGFGGVAPVRPGNSRPERLRAGGNHGVPR